MPFEDGLGTNDEQRFLPSLKGHGELAEDRSIEC